MGRAVCTPLFAKSREEWATHFIAVRAEGWATRPRERTNRLMRVSHGLSEL